MRKKMKSEVKLVEDKAGERLVLFCPKCGEGYAPNAGHFCRCPKCLCFFAPSFQEVQKLNSFSPEGWKKLIRAVAQSPIDLIRCDGINLEDEIKNERKPSGQSQNIN